MSIYAYIFETNNFDDVYSYIHDTEEEYIFGNPYIIVDEKIDTNYILNIAIDEYVSNNTRSKNEEIVKKYGFFDAINLQKDNYGLENLDTDNEGRFYAQLAYNIIYEDFFIRPLIWEEFQKEKKKEAFLNTENELMEYNRENPNASIIDKKNLVRSVLEDDGYDTDDIQEFINLHIV